MCAWLVIGVETGVPWPKEDTEAIFRGRKFLLGPETEDFAPSIAFEYPKDMEHKEALSLCREFMSALSWVENQPVREIMVTGGGRPIQAGKGPIWYATTTPKFRKDYLPEPADPKAKLALALYREAQSINSTPYAFLGYFKILNILHPNGASQKKWINDNIDKITDYAAVQAIDQLKVAYQDLGDHLYRSGRCAVAHAYSGTIINPDSRDDTERLQKELPIIRELAEFLIEQELGVKSQSTIWKEHLYELEGFRELMPEALLGKLKKKEPLNIQVPIQLPPLTVGIRDKPDYKGFSGFLFECEKVVGGILILHGRSPDGILEMKLALDFFEERLKFDLFHGVNFNEDGSTTPLEYAISHRRFLIDLICNGEFVVKSSETGKLLGRTGAYIAVNIDLDRTIRNLENQIAYFTKHLLARQKKKPRKIPGKSR